MFPQTLKVPSLLLCVVSVFAGPGVSRAADDYLGAGAILQKAGKGPEAAGPTPAQLRARIDAFKPAYLSPEEAAGEWLALFDAQGAMARAGAAAATVSVGEIFAKLPPPPAWAALKAAVAQRPPAGREKAMRELSLRIIAELLAGDPAAALREIDRERGGATFMYGGDAMLDQMAQSLISSLNDPDLSLSYLEKRLERPPLSSRENLPLAVPDLVAIAGNEKATALLLKILTQTPFVIEWREETATTKLARDLAEKEVARLKAPQWNLASTMEGAALFEGLEKRFPLPRDGESYTRRQAEGFYLAYLVANGKFDEAEKRILGPKEIASDPFPYQAEQIFRSEGKIHDLFEFLDRVLSKNPNLPFWDRYISAAIDSGETDRALKRVDAARTSDQASEKTKQEIDGKLPEILLALDKQEEGLAALQKAVAFPILEDGPERLGMIEARLNSAAKLARLGLLLDRQPLVEEGVKQARAAARSAKKIEPAYTDTVLPGLLFETGRGGEAERALGESLKEKTGRDEEVRDILIDLCAVYSKAGREADVITLLEKAPGWQARDLAEILTESTSRFSKGKASLSIGYLAAKALYATGNRPEAEKVLGQVLNQEPGFDPAYELLLATKGAAALEDLDRMAAEDRFEERPLIWKAQLLLDAGKAEEAEAVIRKAIAIDPSDGEEGPGDRMRAYAILAAIREARGDADEAALYQGVVKAIRLSEKADRFAEAGLMSRAVAMYQEALTHFADAYCVQSRLARNLWELGRHEEAEKHYQRAYELMPESFGRVESHCFGCEGAFQGRKQQKIAERIFTRLAKETPNKPQVHYLLGYLLEEQGRKGEALASYREAVRLDPDYLNAWKKIAAFPSGLSAGEKEAAVIQAVRLDPLGRHGSRESLYRLRNLKTVWEIAEKIANARNPSPQGLYDLKASRERFDEGKRNPDARFSFVEERSPFSPAGEVTNSFSWAIWMMGY